MYLIPVSCPRRMIDVQLVIADKACAERFYNMLVESEEEHGYRILPIMEVDVMFANALIHARTEAEEAFIAHLIRYELNP
jgi:hypothetical protein